MDRGDPLLVARAKVGVPPDAARRWFLELEAHPERYSFESHAGFRFVRGGFGQAGSRFETRERFGGVEIALRFELQAVEEACFQFRLLRPRLPIWCAFVIEQAGQGSTDLRLEVGATRAAGRLFLGLPGLRGLVRRQIDREVEHICRSMEAL